MHEENQKLDQFKNRFLPSFGEGNGGDGDGTGEGRRKRTRDGKGPVEWGTEPEVLNYEIPEQGLQIGKGILVSLRAILSASVRDRRGRPVHATIEWLSSDAHVATFAKGDKLDAYSKGACQVWARVKGTKIEGPRVPVQVWAVDHILLTPRSLDIPLGKQEQITAEVTDDEGHRSTDVLLEWLHDADDQMTVLIDRTGVVTGNRLGRTAVTAGAGGVWARIPVEVRVIANPEEQGHGTGFPQLYITGRDQDPATGQIREGDPDQPALWQEASDYIHNIWWLNLQSPEAAFVFRQRSAQPTLWRTYHAEKLMEMVVQVWMTDEFSRKGESQRPEFWAAHQAALDRHRVRTVGQMWKRLESYVANGTIGNQETESVIARRAA